jgi:hypothetical protein
MRDVHATAIRQLGEWLGGSTYQHIVFWYQKPKTDGRTVTYTADVQPYSTHKIQLDIRLLG